MSVFMRLNKRNPTLAGFKILDGMVQLPGRKDEGKAPASVRSLRVRLLFIALLF